MATTRTSIPKPDVKVTITPATVTPTQVLPGLPAVVVGACYQVLDPQLSTGLAENPDALVLLPAMLRGHGQAGAAPLAVGAGLSVTIGLNVNGVPVSTTFNGGGGGISLPAAAVVTALNAAIAAAGAGATVEIVGTGTEARFIVRTTGTGAGQVIYWLVTSATAGLITGMTTLLVLPPKWKATGASGYDQRRQVFQFGQYPDPRGIIADMDVDIATVRLFASLSSGLSEWFKSQTIERCGGCSIEYRNDGDSDGYTNLVRFNSTATPSDIADISPGAPTDAELYKFTSALTATRATFNTTGGVPYGSCADPIAVDGDLVIEVNGMEPQVISVAAADSADDLAAKINLVFPGLATGTMGGTDYVSFDLAGMAAILPNADAYGRESYIRITGGSALLQAIWSLWGAVATSRLVRGKWRTVNPGDELYVGGSFIGNVIEVTWDATPYGQLKLDREFPEDTGGAVARSFYIVAKGLTDGIKGSSTYPGSDLFVATSSDTEPEGTVQLKSEMLRDAVTGAPQRIPLTTSGVACNEYMGYTGLRLDVTAVSANPDLLQYASAVDLTSELAPVDTTNPLALGIYFAMLNSPGILTYGLGISEVSTAEPEGTLDAFTIAAEFLEAKEVYSIAQLTHSEDVAKMFEIHVDAMSDPEMKSERIDWFCPSFPTRERSTLAASGARGNSGVIAGTTGVFHTALPDLPARLLAAGITITGTPDTDKVYLQTEAFGSKMFAILSVSGPDVTLTDYTATVSPALPFETDISVSFSTALIDEPFTIAKLGASLYTGTVYDKQKAAEALYDLGQEFADRRVRMVVPDEIIATIGGLEQVIPGYYACCCLAGMKAAANPSQGFTNLAVSGINGVQKTQGFFKESQLNLIAGGGGWILIPGPGGGGVVTRMSLTTDTSSVEYRQDSWTSALDYGAKYIRIMLRRVIGPTNITQAAIDLVASLVDGCMKYLVDAYIWTEGVLESIIQSSVAPDTLEVGVSAKIPYNLNYINVNITV